MLQIICSGLNNQAVVLTLPFYKWLAPLSTESTTHLALLKQKSPAWVQNLKMPLAVLVAQVAPILLWLVLLSLLHKQVAQAALLAPLAQVVQDLLLQAPLKVAEIQTSLDNHHLRK
jgi:hypothetical protein